VSPSNKKKKSRKKQADAKPAAEAKAADAKAAEATEADDEDEGEDEEDLAHSETVVAKVDEPAADKVDAKADKPEAKADKPEAKADKPEAKADKAAKADKPELKAAEPKPAKAAKPSTRAGKPIPKPIAVDNRGRRVEDEPDWWDQTIAWIFAHGALPALALITIGVGITFSHLFAGEPRGDDLTFHMAESARLADCLRAHDWDLWNPSANGGYASAYYYQVIPQMTSAIPAAIFGHLLFWFQLSNWLPLVLAPAAAYRGMRMLGATPWQATMAAFCVAFMNGESRWGAGAAGSFHVGLYTQTWALTAFPLALGYGAHWVSKGKKLAPAVAWGAFCGLCHPFAVVSLAVALVVASAAQLVFVGTDLLFITIGRSLEPVAPRRKPLEFFPRIRHDLATRWKSLPGLARVDRGWPAVRIAILGLLMFVAWAPIWAPLLVDYDGFGGFPHRVGDEIGPGFAVTWDWFWDGKLLDFIPDPDHRYHVLTWLFFPTVLFARGKFMRWLLVPTFFYGLLLGLGPHLGTTQDDLFPMVRFLGAMQTCMALAIGAGMIGIGQYLWKLFDDVGGAYIARTVLVAVGGIFAVLTVVGGARSLSGLIAVMGDPNMNQHRDEMLQIADFLETQPQGRKQVAAGAENHWWNLLTYVYGRTPALLQMGGGGLQASPNYDYLWTGRDLTKNAWLYAAPYLVFARQAESKMPPGDTIFIPRGKHVQFDDPNPFWPKVHVVDGPGSYEVRRLPAPELISPVQVTGVLPPGPRKGEPGRDAALAWLKTDGPIVDHVLAYDGYGSAGDTPDGNTIKAWRQMSPGDDPDIVADVEVKSHTTTFLVRESWHPRWHAFIDGEEVPVRRMTPDFPAVDVPPGKHEVALRFQRPWWVWASWLLWPGASIAALFLSRMLIRRFPSAENPDGF
jgi:hypothetical protein